MHKIRTYLSASGLVDKTPIPLVQLKESKIMMITILKMEIMLTKKTSKASQVTLKIGGVSREKERLTKRAPVMIMTMTTMMVVR